MDPICLDLIVTLIIGVLTGDVLSTGEVIYAVNNGGPAHTDLNGVHYQADQLAVGVPSDFGKMLTIGRVAPPDQILYQTERYHLSNFGYTIPIKENGDYVLILKFCEVYFQAPRLKVKLISTCYETRKLVCLFFSTSCFKINIIQTVRILII